MRKNIKRLLREVSRVDISCPKLVIQETYVSVYINSDKQTPTTEVIKPPPFSVDVDTFHGPKPDREYIHGLLMENKAGEMLFYSYLTHKFINYSKFFS